jgi:hypothetical protein
MWIQWIDRFGKEMGRSMHIPESSKYEILRGVLRSINVSYDPEKQVHMFTINFNIPIIMEENCSKNSLRQKTKTMSKSADSTLKPKSTLTYYSTVTDFARLRGLSTSQPRKTAM